jgi:tryptophan synthase beta subunit
MTCIDCFNGIWVVLELLPTRVQAEMEAILKDYVGRETPLYFAERLSQHYKT